VGQTVLYLHKCNVSGVLREKIQGKDKVYLLNSDKMAEKKVKKGEVEIKIFVPGGKRQMWTDMIEVLSVILKVSARQEWFE
jgi:hypothetical protein